jgi:hypothetical protein
MRSKVTTGSSKGFERGFECSSRSQILNDVRLWEHELPLTVIRFSEPFFSMVSRALFPHSLIPSRRRARVHQADNYRSNY